MKTEIREFRPFSEILIPIFSGRVPESVLGLARDLGVTVNLLGLVHVASDASMSAAAADASPLRKELRRIRNEAGIRGTSRVIVTQNPVEELRNIVTQEPPDLLALEWPLHFECMDCMPEDLLAFQSCNIVVVRGKWPQKIRRILAPLRGGPNAGEIMRLGLALPHDELTALHLYSPEAAGKGVEPPLKGLLRVLPYLSGVNYRHLVSSNPIHSILSEANLYDLLVVGASAQRTHPQRSLGSIVGQLLKQVDTTVVVVKTKEDMPAAWTGAEGELAGSQAISLLVDRWFAENTYHADEFDDLETLFKLKQEQGVSISLALPALNEEKTVGTVIESIKTALMDQVPLLDEIVLIDSNSSDQTRQIARSLGVPVYIHQELLPSCGARKGKGEALWKSLLVTSGDIIVWIDTDIVNIHPRFVYGVIGPMLVNPQLQFVKGFYQRPLRSGSVIQSSGGGRVTELTARPLINLFYPELSGIIQPLSGEYGGRRKALEQLPFFSGYGVETGLLIDMFETYGLSTIAQVNLLERIHHNQPLEALSKMSFVILQAFFRKLERRFDRSFLEEVNKTMKLVSYEDGRYSLNVEEVVEWERMPMVQVREYVEKHLTKPV
ncbi:MAG: glucosyl-3-phosphoglycerate synthase [Anaerolineaceae bacterium]|nr:glucosyl-3-phosphoglycerate synthase [Anaerolineaceae bacterium]